MKPILLLTAMLVLVTLISLVFGSATLSLQDLLAVLMGQSESSTRTIIWDIRLPRSLLALLVGAGIAASGAAIQGLFRNPLADPALIGVSAGSALFASLFVLIGGTSGFALMGLAGSAFIGGLAATWVVLMVGLRAPGISTMLLAGIAINAIALSGVGLLSYLSTDVQLRSISFWALGSLNGANWASVGIATVIPVIVFLLSRLSIRLNIVTLGEAEAFHLGVSERRLRTQVVVLCAMAVGVGVALSGVIAFLGLIVPHLVRMLISSNHQVVIPVSALAGGMLLLLADVLSRTLLAPAELPVGILTALIGGPFFIYLILMEQRSRWAL